MTKYKYTPEELDLIYQNYSSEGPKWLGERLGLSLKTVSKKARRMGLYRGQVAANQKRKHSWQFKEWSYDLGYIVGVYLGDGNVWQVENSTSYFRLSVIDKDFCEATQDKIYKEIGVLGSIRPRKNNQYCLTICNVDFCSWLVKNFGPAKHKRIRLLPILEANKGMIEGLIDSEGSISKSSISLRMDGNLAIVQEICNQLHIQPGRGHKGVRQELWQSPTFQGYSISIKEYTKAGLGTYIKRKAINGLCYKGN